MNKQEQERLFDYMFKLTEMLIDTEREVGRKGKYSLAYEIEQLENSICTVQEKLYYYFEHGIEDEKEE